MGEHCLAIDTITCWLDEDSEITCDAYVVLDDDGQWRFISIEYRECENWIAEHWREFAEPEAVAEYDYGLT